MGVTRKVALAFTAICLIAAAVSMLGSTKMTLCTGSRCSTWDCGSAAFPKETIDFERTTALEDAANCAGQTPASFAFYCVLLAGLGVGVAGFTSRRSSKDDAGAEAVGVEAGA